MDKQPEVTCEALAARAGANVDLAFPTPGELSKVGDVYPLNSKLTRRPNDPYHLSGP